MTDNNNRNTLKEAFDAELMKRLEENPPEIPTYEEFSAMVDKLLAERRRRRNRIAGIAAGFVVVLLAGILVCTNLTTDVDADKNPKEEIITEDGVIIEDGGWGSSEYEDNVWITEDWDEVADARDIMPNLIIPRYVPEGYRFNKLMIEILTSGATTSEYSFINKDETVIEIEIYSVDGGSLSTSISKGARSIESEKGIIHILDEEDDYTKIAIIKINDGTNVQIVGNISDENIVKMVEKLQFRKNQ